MSRDNENKLLADAAVWLKGHSYTQLVNTNGVEVWRCQTPGSIHQAFEICMTRFGIAVFGDIGSLTFSVGASYGLKFLAGEDGEHIYDKLEPRSKESELDRDYFVHIVCEAIKDLLHGRVEDIPSWKQAPTPLSEVCAELDNWLMMAADNRFPTGLHQTFLSAMVVALRSCQNLEGGVTEAYAWIGEHEELLDLGSDLDYDLRKPTNSVLRRLAKVRHAARIIVAQKAAAEAQAVPQ